VAGLLPDDVGLADGESESRRRVGRRTTRAWTCANSGCCSTARGRCCARGSWTGSPPSSVGAPLLTEILADRRRVRGRQVIDRPLVCVEPGDVARRKLQIEDAQWPALKHLSMMWLLMHGHDRRLAVPICVRRLPRRALPSDGNAVGDEAEDHEGERW